MVQREKLENRGCLITECFAPLPRMIYLVTSKYWLTLLRWVRHCVVPWLLFFRNINSFKIGFLWVVREMPYVFFEIFFETVNRNRNVSNTRTGNNTSDSYFAGSYKLSLAQPNYQERIINNPMVFPVHNPTVPEDSVEHQETLSQNILMQALVLCHNSTCPCIVFWWDQLIPVMTKGPYQYDHIDLWGAEWCRWCLEVITHAYTPWQQTMCPCSAPSAHWPECRKY